LTYPPGGRRQLEDVADHNVFAALKKATHLLAILQRQAADFLHSIPAGSIYKGIARTLKSRY
jgi:hypothetical protein